MKNTKAIFLIILGSFIIATGFAFAGESVSFNQLVAMEKSGSATFDGLPGAGNAPIPPQVNAANAGNPLPTTPVQTAAQQTPPKPGDPAAAAKPEEKPTFKDKLNKYLKEHMSTMVMTGIGAYAGFALLGGPVGLIIGALFMYTLNYMGNNV